jgi:hypothetical protein
MKRAVLGLFAAACATTGASGEGDRELPTAGVGPFRELREEEVRGIAPFVLDAEAARYREPSAIQAGEETWLYAVASVSDRDVIVRTKATDGRTFHGTTTQFGAKPRVVLEPDAPWEGGALAGPDVIRLPSGELLLYYAAAGGIGVARSQDGVTFTKHPGNPVLVRDPAAAPWESTEVRAPAPYALADGRIRLLYASGGSLGEAESGDGLSFRRLGVSPVLGPAPMPAPGSLLPNEKPPFDTASVDDPSAHPRTTPAGRFHLRVVYTGRDGSGGSTIGFAGRYGESGPLDRNLVAVYAAGQGESAPTMVERSEGTFLYLEQNKGTGARAYRAIAGAFAPANVLLPPPSEFPDAP